MKSAPFILSLGILVPYLSAMEKVESTILELLKQETVSESEVLTLIQHGANVHIEDNNGLTPLHLAAWKGYTKTVIALLKRGANIHATDKDFENPIRKLMIGSESLELLPLEQDKSSPAINILQIEGEQSLSFGGEKDDPSQAEFNDDVHAYSFTGGWGDHATHSNQKPIPWSPEASQAWNFGGGQDATTEKKYQRKCLAP